MIAAIKQAETNLDDKGQRVSLDDTGVLTILTRQAKQRKESIVEYRKGGRQDLVDEEQAELEILQEYLEKHLPQQLTRNEIEDEARKAIRDVDATGRQDMGKVMRLLMDRLRGRADGKVVNQVVTELLTGQGG
ncbi:MAG: GatB/YqeY domain-containing protein [Anaerolineae bacterium]